MISKFARYLGMALGLLFPGKNGVADAPLQPRFVRRDFVGVAGNQFRLNGREYKALGFTSYSP